tara:strand:+ start:1777 stop:1974 length:198 start_codon:yes stop_codon:yes gene_type:complete
MATDTCEKCYRDLVTSHDNDSSELSYWYGGLAHSGKLVCELCFDQLDRLEDQKIERQLKNIRGDE